MDFSNAFSSDTREFLPVVLPPKAKFKIMQETPKLDISILGSRRDKNYHITEDSEPSKFDKQAMEEKSLIKPNGKVTRVKKTKKRKKTACITETWDADW